jgi:hypothetical protein
MGDRRHIIVKSFRTEGRALGSERGRSGSGMSWIIQHRKVVQRFLFAFSA